MKTQITKIKNERRDVAADYKERIMREYYEQLHAKELDGFVEVHTFLERHKLVKLTQ